MRCLWRKIEENHWKELPIEIDVFVSLLTYFKRTAPGVRYYVNCTEEQDAEEHKKVAVYILKTLRYIKNIDIGAYKTMVHLYKEDIRNVIAVYRESKEKA